jgi:NAD(P)-dependent dehydrogenase (short-subunit alcohol dehydrogenase family)
MKPTRKTVLITGAAKRIGRQVALELAQNGWNIAIHYKTSHHEALQTQADCAQYGAIARVYAADLANEAQVLDLIPSIIKEFGVLDALVNCASVFELDADDKVSFSSFNAHMHANLAAPLLLSQALYTHVQSRHSSGCIVNFLDQKLWNTNPDFLSYTLSKAGLQQATAMLAQAFAPHVRVCGIAPGLTYPSFLQTDAQFTDAAKHSLRTRYDFC